MEYQTTPVTIAPISELIMRELLKKKLYFRESAEVLNIPMLVVAHLWETHGAIDDSLGVIRGVNSSTAPDAGLSVIHYAAGYNLPFLMDFAITHNAKIDQPDKDGFTALHFAVLMGHKRMVSDLLANCASRDVKDMNGVSPADLASIMAEKNDFELLATRKEILELF